MLFTVYASCIHEVTKRLDRLARKAARYKVPFSYSVGDEHPATVDVYKVDPATSTQYVAYQRTVAAVDVDVECDECIKANGWTVRAKVEHGDKGNIVTAIGDKPALPAWFSAPARCEHCNTNRNRSVTFFVEHESGEIRQVGRACLHDYTGIAPALATLWAEVRDLFPRDLNYCEGTEWTGFAPTPMYPVADVFAHAYDVIKACGYRKSDLEGSTREDVTERVLRDDKPSDEGRAKGAEILAWLVAREEVARENDRIWDECNTNGDWSAFRALPDKVSDLERNCISLAVSGFAKRTHFGRLAYMPVAYEEYLERMAKAEAKRREAEASPSKHVGEVGARMTINVERAELITSWETMYGRTYLYKFIDADGNIFIWYASRPVDITDNMKVKATIKDHNERDGVKQTIVTRCKVA